MNLFHNSKLEIGFEVLKLNRKSYKVSDRDLFEPKQVKIMRYVAKEDAIKVKVEKTALRIPFIF